MAAENPPDRDGVLTVWRQIGAARELFVRVGPEGVVAYNGHVDLGTGIATALAQIVAEELDVTLEQVRMVLGSVGLGPDQGATIASETIQVTAVPLRAAAAQARAALLALAAAELGVPVAALSTADGTVTAAAPDNRFVSYAALLAGRQVQLTLDEATPVKSPGGYRIVGRPVPRRDIAAKATGGLVYVQDMRVPGMLHGRVVRPPYAGIDSGNAVGNSLIAVDAASVADIPGLVAVVTLGDFVGVVAAREEHAALAAQRLRVSWKPGPRLPDLSDIRTALLENPSTPRTLLDRGDVDAAIADAATPLHRSYVWPYQMHAAIGPSCSLADWQPDGLTVWSGTQNPHALRTDLAQLMDMAEQQIVIHRMEAAGCYGRNCADDVGADAALLSRAVGRPVRVQLTREQEHAWEPKGAAQLLEVRGALDGDGDVAAYDFRTRYPSNRAPTLALILTGGVSNQPLVSDMGDRTAVPPFDFPAMRITVHDTPPIVRAAWLRGVSALPNTFAHESWIDEAAYVAGVDPVAYRLRSLRDPRAVAVLTQTAARAGWQPRTAPRMRQDAEGLLHGQGVAYARYVHGPFPGTGAAWSAWVTDVTVDPRSGEVRVVRVVAGQDSGLMINPDGVRHQLAGNVIQSVSRVLKEEVHFDMTAVSSRDWGAYPILGFPDLPALEPVLLDRRDQPPVGAGESASVPSAAAIANAIFDATGVRFREVPFTPERIKAGLPPVVSPAPAPAPPPARDAPRHTGWQRPRAAGWRAALLGGLATLGGVALAALPFRAAIDPVARTDAAIYAPATIARGKILAALGDCAVCHRADFAGGHMLDTPFGQIASPNITPDTATGIGTWSYAAFARAMRQGVHRDGRLLYPAFPYPSYALVTEADLQALYAFLMSVPPVVAPAPASALRFPFNLRPLMAGWNALFLRAAEFAPDPRQSDAWNRGAYLVEGLGHCGGCHTPRNALGAERGGAAHLAGGMAEGWDAPALNGTSPAPLPWTETDLYDYLRSGTSRFHGVAAGPMAPVVQQLAIVPDADIRAMAVYLASFAPAEAAAQQGLAGAREARTMPGAPSSLGARLYDGACAVCHQPGRGPVLSGARPSLALNTTVHANTADNLIRTVLGGIQQPANAALGAMPGFAQTLDDAQVAALVGYIRGQFAPDAPAWPDVTAQVKRLRTMP